MRGEEKRAPGSHDARIARHGDNSAVIQKLSALMEAWRRQTHIRMKSLAQQTGAAECA
jgi:hypothetical protein